MGRLPLPPPVEGGENPLPLWGRLSSLPAAWKGRPQRGKGEGDLHFHNLNAIVSTGRYNQLSPCPSQGLIQRPIPVSSTQHGEIARHRQASAPLLVAPSFRSVAAHSGESSAR